MVATTFIVLACILAVSTADPLGLKVFKREASEELQCPASDVELSGIEWSM